jgi:hypothetical protein
LRRRGLKLFAAGLVVIVMIVVWFYRDGVQGPPVSVRFIGFTNITVNEVGALFEISNQSPVTVARSSICFFDAPSPLGVSELFGPQSRVWRPTNSGPGALDDASQTLRPGESEVVQIYCPPPTQTVWSATFNGSRENTRQEIRAYETRERLFYWAARVGLQRLVDEPQGLREVSWEVCIRGLTNITRHAP